MELEDGADDVVQERELLFICTYDAEVLPVSSALELQRSHGYIMTDSEFFASVLYENVHEPVVLPSLSEQQKVQVEMDLYKQKLDFAHVVSHEVRNPLTIIKAYCLMLLNTGVPLEEAVAESSRKSKIVSILLIKS